MFKQAGLLSLEHAEVRAVKHVVMPIPKHLSLSGTDEGVTSDGA